MALTQNLVFLGIAVLVGLLTRRRGRNVLLLFLSVLAVYWLQPSLRIPTLDFWLPTATLVLVIISWILTASPEARSWRANWHTLLITALAVLFVLAPKFGIQSLTLVSKTPALLPGLITLTAVTLLIGLLSRVSKPPLLWVLFAAILLIFLVLKIPTLTLAVSTYLRGLTGLSVKAVSSQDLGWLGFSYIAFRLLHTIRDRQAGRLPSVNLGEYLTYVIFFPALSAGPIDRIERFVGDLRQPQTLDWLEAGQRLAVGFFKKFVLADTLSLIALNGANAPLLQSSLWAWVLVYAYAFQIYFDFSGYTDMAIGLGLLLGVRLPENFKAPYRKVNIAQFWNNWHMTLTQWFRSYFFNPLTRALRSSKRAVSIPLIILLTQISTMVLIGLWHGVTWNYALWGLWHGIGLFVHNRWNSWAGAKVVAWAQTPFQQAVVNVTGVVLTFNFVALGWVFFALPSLSSSYQVFSTLFGFH
jgi:alginate O-acetyltransferase complex protein AlgI